MSYHSEIFEKSIFLDDRNGQLMPQKKAAWVPISNNRKIRPILDDSLKSFYLAKYQQLTNSLNLRSNMNFTT